MGRDGLFGDGGLRQRLSFGNVNRDPTPDPDDISEMRQTLRDELAMPEVLTYPGAQ
ncbi:hypothetical protein E4U34_000173, partial [Claviceps purpurea]